MDAYNCAYPLTKQLYFLYYTTETISLARRLFTITFTRKKAIVQRTPQTPIKRMAIKYILYQMIKEDSSQSVYQNPQKACKTKHKLLCHSSSWLGKSRMESGILHFTTTMFQGDADGPGTTFLGTTACHTRTCYGIWSLSISPKRQFMWHALL